MESNNYYIIINGQQQGPMSIAELVQRGLKPESIVWRPGMEDWVPASEVPELREWLSQSNAEPQPTYCRQAEAPREPYKYPEPGVPHNPYGQPQQPYPPYSPNPYQNPYGQPYGPNQVPRHTNWMTAAIIATVIGALFSCIGLVFGIIAITQASSANNAYARGDVYEGDRYNSKAKTWTIVTYVVCGLGFIATVIWGIITAFASLATI